MSSEREELTDVCVCWITVNVIRVVKFIFIQSPGSFI